MSLSRRRRYGRYRLVVAVIDVGGYEVKCVGRGERGELGSGKVRYGGVGVGDGGGGH